MGKVHPVVVAVSIALVVITAWCLPRRPSWKRLSDLDPTQALLTDRRRLLEIAATHEDGETRLEAVRRLLVLQDPGTRRPPLPKGDGIDHPYMSIEDDGPKDYFSCIVTLSEEPDLPGRHPRFWEEKHKSDDEDYWSVDRLAFDRDGRLLHWAPYSFGIPSR